MVKSMNSMRKRSASHWDMPPSISPIMGLVPPAMKTGIEERNPQVHCPTGREEQIIANVTKEERASVKKCSLFVLHAHARSHPEGGGDGGKYGDQNVQDFSPDVLVFHDLIYDLFFLHHRVHRVPRSFFSIILYILSFRRP